MNKFAIVSLATLAGSAYAAVPAGVEAAITTGGADAVSVVGYMIVASVAIWGVLKMLGIIGGKR